MFRVHFFSLVLAILLVATGGRQQNLYSQSPSLTQWEPVGGGIYGGVVSSLAVAKGVVFASTPNGLFRSKDEGKTWSEVNGGLPSLTRSSSQIFVTPSGTVLAGTAKGMYRSVDAGQTWMPVTTGLPSANATVTVNNAFYGDILYPANQIFGIGGIETSLVAVTHEGVYRSEDDGQSWVRVRDKFPSRSGTFRAAGNSLYYGSERGLYYSSDKGKTWTILPVNGQNEVWVTAISSTRSMLYVQLNESDSNRFWRVKNGGSVAERYVAPLQGRADFGAFTRNVEFDDILEVDGVLLAKTFTLGFHNTTSIIRSSDDGATWTGSAAGIPNNAQQAGWYRSGTPALVRVGNTVLCAPEIGGVYRSGDGGKTWSASHVGITGHEIDCLAAKGSLVLAAARGRMFRSEDAGVSWQTILDTITAVSLPNGSTTTLADFNTVLFTPDSMAFALAQNGGLLRSANGGRTWQHILTESGHSNLAAEGANIYVVGAFNSGLRRSSDNGATWTSLGLGSASNINVSSLSVSANYIYITVNNSLLRSSDNGTTWRTLPTNNIGGAGTVSAFGGTLLLGTAKGVYRSTNKGETWTEANTGLSDTSQSLNPLEFGQALFVNQPTFKLRTVVRFAHSGANILANTFGGIYSSNDDGRTWSKIKGLQYRGSAVSLATSSEGIPFAADGGKVYKLSFGETTTSIRLGSKSMYADKENTLLIAPNPLRGNGHITYRVQEAAHVRISLINSLGQVVEILHDADQSVGEHSLSLDASRYPAGIYMIRIEAEGLYISSTSLIITSK